MSRTKRALRLRSEQAGEEPVRPIRQAQGGDCDEGSGSARTPAGLAALQFGETEGRPRRRPGRLPRRRLAIRLRRTRPTIRVGEAGLCSAPAAAAETAWDVF